MALYPLYGPLPPLRSSVTLYSPLFYGPLFSLRPSVPPAALCPLFSPVIPLRFSVPSTAFCPLDDLPSPLLRPYVPSTAPLPPLRPSIPSTALYFSMALYLLYGPLYTVQHSVPSSAFCHLYGLFVPSTRHFSLFRKMMMLFRCFAKHDSPKRAISQSSESSETTPLVSRNSQTGLRNCFVKNPT